MSSGGGYIPESGTSLAAPHVSGVAALLLAKTRGLTPYQLRFILEETSTNINGAEQPDPGAGWGRLRTLDALAYTPDLSAYDLTVGAMGIRGSANPGQILAITNLCRNLGGQVVGNSEVRFYFADDKKRVLSDLDPMANGEPDPTKFKYIASCFIPIIGPKGTLHAAAPALVRWTAPAMKQQKWWLGARIIPGPASNPEGNPNNNAALFLVP
jgi:hypothetical protein